MTVTSKQQLLTSAEESLLEVKWEAEKKIEFSRQPNEELGITVVYGRMYTKNNALGSIPGLFVKSVTPNSAAGRTGQFQSGDKILEVCGTYVDELSREDAIAFIRNVENPISFVVQSMTPIRKPCFMPNGLPENQAENKSQDGSEFPKLPEPETVSNESETKAGDCEIKEFDYNQEKNKAPVEVQSEEEESEDEDELESHDTVTVKKKFASIENKIEVEVEKGPHGLGISLAGHKNRNKMAVFVCGINPNSPVFKTGGIQVGDEILQVNDSVLYGHSHLNASSIIKRIAGSKIKFLVTRRKIGMDDVAVRPVSYFPEILEEETSQQKYEKYPNVQDIEIEKGNSTLGIMIIEGKHAELGQGIFVSDVLEDSPADKAGVQIGDMILAANRETLVGSSYDQATTLLKRLEGLVVITVSTPTKKVSESPETIQASDDKGKSSSNPSPAASRPPSRAMTPVPVDPATCAIIPGQRTTIEINMENKVLGLFLICPKASLKKSVFIIDIYGGGSAEKDGRLKIGDEILEAAETVFKDSAVDVPLQVLQQALPKIKMTVFRPQTMTYESVEVELTKAPGKGIGLSMMGRKDGKGAFVYEILEGGNAESDKRISIGDILVLVNEINVETLSCEEVGAALKSIVGKVKLKFNRLASSST